MTKTEKLRKKLTEKLCELFQLDQPDLDFGFYRIMHAKSQQVKSFLENDLLKIIEDAFGQQEELSTFSLREEAKQELVKTLGEDALDGNWNVQETYVKLPAAKKYAEEITRINDLKDKSTVQADIYDHLYRFFERYYDQGDFMSRRYHTRENSGKAAPYAIPYNGEEVKLHWANADQYYIKTAEYFSNFSFDITQAAEIRVMDQMERGINAIPNSALKVHFKIIEAGEGEHGNVKAAEDKKRFFVLHQETPLEFNEAGELVINFEYKSLPGGKNDVDEQIEKMLKDKYGKSLNKGDMPNLVIADQVIQRLETTGTQVWTQTEERGESTNAEEWKSVVRGYLSAFKLVAPTKTIPNRPLLTKYINQYTSRNTYDYFIHKDLGSFLKRELDFYIKNEVMHLDDIEDADVPAVESYLAKLKVIRKISIKLIDFLAQLEDFQKKLWLKKKFVTETNYCITLDRIPKRLYNEIASNDAQREEWVKLFAIDEIKGDSNGLPSLASPGYTVPLTTEFLKANDKLVLDTEFFNDGFKADLIEHIEDFDEQCDGLLIHSENFQALNLLQERYREQVKCVYIDPPYNTNATPIIYKNEYKHSSWNSLIYDRLVAADKLTASTAFLITAIDHAELYNLGKIKDSLYGENRRLAIVTVQHNPKGRNQSKFFSENTEYLLFYGKDKVKSDFRQVAIDEKVAESFDLEDEIGRYRYENFIRARTVWSRKNKPNNWYPIYVSPDLRHITSSFHQDYHELYPRTKQGEFSWKNICESFEELNKDDYFVAKKEGDEVVLLHKYREQQVLKNLWADKKYQSEFHGTNLVKAIIGPNVFDYPKSIYAVLDVIKITTDKQELVLDYFAGSGTTGHAVISLNREDKGTRKYILAEMGDHFKDVLKPRITKVIYSSDWKDGKPTTRNAGISHCFKYIRLESYEDTLNNLVFDENPDRDKAIENNPSLKEDYMLRYLLEVETRGSQSLLNIDDFYDPTAYTLKVKKPGSDAQITQNIDLIETFNYLIGLRLEHTAAPQSFSAAFTRKSDPELPEDQHTKLVVDGKIKPIENRELKVEIVNSQLSTANCSWWFRKLEGWIPANPMNPNNGEKERVLIVWRKLTGNLEEDNLMLDEWFKKYRISTRDFEYDTIYVNGSNNLPNLKKDDENWKVRLIEEEFHKKMWEAK
ncbi:MAG: site-specific DNA-methyltransferase [Kiritimatiellia bacterium]